MISEGALRLIQIMDSGAHVVTNAVRFTAIDYDDWPLWAKAMSRLSSDEDTGIGDVVHRMIGDENSESFKAWYKKTTGRDCGCTGRRVQWNIQFPLPVQNVGDSA